MTSVRKHCWENLRLVWCLFMREYVFLYVYSFMQGSCSWANVTFHLFSQMFVPQLITPPQHHPHTRYPHVSGISHADAGPSSESQREDTRSAWRSGQILQQRFLCSTHLLVLARSAGPQNKFGQAFVKKPDPFMGNFFRKYDQPQSNVRME